MRDNIIEPGIDAVFLPGKIHGCEDEIYIIYYNECANEGNGCFEIEICDYETILKLYDNVAGDTEDFFGELPGYFHGEWGYADRGTELFDALYKAYPTADFIVGRDGSVSDEMLFVTSWAKERMKINER